LGVTPTPGDKGPQLTVVESVRCLECGAVYAKPQAGGTVRENPGCPECGYVGWTAASPEQFNEEWQPGRSAEGRQPHRAG
jgi:predicted  nucleic acid-binding Zn-ribbon protein